MGERQKVSAGTTLIVVFSFLAIVCAAAALVVVALLHCACACACLSFCALRDLRRGVSHARIAADNMSTGPFSKGNLLVTILSQCGTLEKRTK